MAGAREIRAGKAYVELSTKDAKLTAGLERVRQRLAAWGASLRAAGMGLTGLGAGILTPLLGAAKTFASTGSELQDLSERTGISAARLSSLSYAAGQAGTDLATVETAVRKMQRTITAATGGTAAAAEALQLLGLSAAELQGMSPEQQFDRIADALSRVADPTTRAALATELFGRSGTQILPMLAAGIDGLRQLEARARALGLTMSNEDAAAADALDDAFATLWDGLKGLTRTVGAALAPALTELATRAAEVLGGVIRWVRENHGLIVSVAQLAAGVVALGGALTAAGVALWAITTPIGMAVTAVAGLGAGLVALYATGSSVIPWLVNAFITLGDFATGVFRGMADALAAGDIEAAAKVLWTGLKVAWLSGTQDLRETWIGFTAALTEHILTAAYEMREVFAKFAAWLKGLWTNIFAGIETGVAQSRHELTDLILSIWGTFDSSLDVEGAKAVGESELAQRVSAVEAARAQVLQEVSRELQQTTARLNQERDTALGLAAGDAADRLTEAREELQQAREELQRLKAGVNGPGGIPEIPGLDKNEVDSELQRATAQAFGSFNAAILGQMVGAGSAAERTAKATERTAKAVEQIDRKPGLVFVEG